MKVITIDNDEIEHSMSDADLGSYVKRKLQKDPGKINSSRYVSKRLVRMSFFRTSISLMFLKVSTSRKLPFRIRFFC